MKFVYPGINHVFDTECEKVHTLIIENQRLFSDLLNDLTEQLEGDDGKSVVSVDNKVMATDKYLEVISQFIPFSINQKNLINKMIAELEKKAVDSDYYEKTMKLLAELEGFLIDLFFDFAGDIEYSKLNIGNIIKSVGPVFAEEYNSLGEKLIDYIELVTEYDRTKLFVLVNLRSYISDEEASLFMDTVLKHKYHVLMIESSEHKSLDNEKRYIVDKDLCEIG